VAKEFRQKYPGVALRIYVEALGGTVKPVLDGRCSLGVVGSLPMIPDTMTHERMPGIAFLMVAARDHAPTSYRGKIPKEVLENIPRSFSPTGRSYPGDANSASRRLRRGGLLTSLPSIIFCSRVSVGAECHRMRCARIWKRIAFPCCRSRACLRMV
jgi:hypothetical protein